MSPEVYLLSLQTIEIAQKLAFLTPNFDKLKPSEASFISQAYNIYLDNSEINIESITDIKTFCNDFGQSTSLFNNLRDKLKKDSGLSEEKIKEVENNSIPSELESMVALYKEHQADLLDSDKTHTVADAVKRARKAWGEREKQHLIYENANAERQRVLDEQKEKFYKNAVEPKKTSRRDIVENVYKIAELAVLAQDSKISSGDLKNATESLVFLAESGSIDISNFNDLNIASALAVKDQVKGFKTEFDEVDSLVQKQIFLQAEDPFSNSSEKFDNEIILASQESENVFINNTKEFRSKVAAQTNDYDTIVAEAQKESTKVISNLSRAIPNARLHFQQNEIDDKTEELEKVIRKLDSTVLNINPTPLGARTSGTLQQTGGSTKISAGVVDLYSKGLTQKKLEELEKNPEFKNLYKNSTRQIHQLLGTVERSKIGEDIKPELPKMGKIGEFTSRLPSGVQKFLHPVDTATAFINKKIGQSAGKQILKYSNSAVGKKLGNFILEHGLKEGSKQFAKNIGEKILISGAKKIGIVIAEGALTTALASASAALGISTAGLSLVVEAALYVAGKVISFGFTKVRQLFFDDEQWKEIKKDAWKGLLIGGALAGSTVLAAGRGVRMFGTATRVAAVSALGIIWLSIATIAVFLSLTYLVAPILTTLVQFDSVEKVQYTNLQVPSDVTPGCPKNWPVTGQWRITQGPGGKVSHYNVPYDQSVDLGTKLGTPVFSTTDGVVSFAAVDKSYVNTNVVIVDSKLPDGKSFQVVYAHLSLMKVKKGQVIKIGTPIGASGYSMWAGSQQVHLHYEYKGIKYNQCPAGNLQLAEGCAGNQVPGAGKKCVSETSGVYLYSN